MSSLKRLAPKFTIVVLLSALITLSVAHIRLSRQYATQQVCDRSHAVQSGRLEEACGLTQDNNHTEYLCNGFKADAFCWVEVK